MSNEHHDAFSFGFAGMLLLSHSIIPAHSLSFIRVLAVSTTRDRLIRENAD
jgi:hypothetical protein